MGKRSEQLSRGGNFFIFIFEAKGNVGPVGVGGPRGTVRGLGRGFEARAQGLRTLSSSVALLPSLGSHCLQQLRASPGERGSRLVGCHGRLSAALAWGRLVCVWFLAAQSRGFPAPRRPLHA